MATNKEVGIAINNIVQHREITEEYIDTVINYLTPDHILKRKENELSC